jgi:branched-chain amino acid aminotransferase
MAKIEAIESGVEEAIMLNEQGYVAETSTENIFIVKNGIVSTPHPSQGVLKGITRDSVVAVTKDLGYPLEERPITIHELYNADEVFVSGTAAEIVPIVKITGRAIGEGIPGPIFWKIFTGFRQMIKKSKEGTPID